MDDEPIRRLLGTVQISPELPARPGTVAILRTRVEAAGGDVDAVDRYVVAHGGQIRETPTRFRHGWDGNFGARIEGAVYYVIPTAALPPEWLAAARR